ncbi:hypothetical protein, partial [Nitratifractor sp.]
TLALAADKTFKDGELPDPILLKVHETFTIQCRPLHKNINWLRYEVQGDAIRLLQRSGDRIKTGYRFEFEARKEGNATLIRTISRYGKRSRDQRETSRYLIVVHP